MKKILNIIIMSLLFLTISCNSGITEPPGLSDAEIIAMIIGSNKLEVSMDDIPESSRSIVEHEYVSYMNMAAKKASGLGYEVELAGLGYRSGQRKELYFNLEGRKLDPNDLGEKGRTYDKNDWNEKENEDWICFEIVFPISFNMPDGSIITVDSEEEGWSEIKNWYELNSDSKEKPSMQYPVVIFIEEGPMILNNNDDLKDAYTGCNYDRRKNRDDYDRKKSCFELVYPISYAMPDGSSLTVPENNESGWSELKNWYNDNAGFEEEKPKIEYPVNIVYEIESGDSSVVINNEEEIMEAKEACFDYWEERDCFGFVYPITFTMPDGSNINVSSDSEDDWYELRHWYQSNSGYSEEPALQFPVDIFARNEQGQITTTINSDEELEQAEESCRD